MAGVPCGVNVWVQGLTQGGQVTTQPGGTPRTEEGASSPPAAKP